MKAWGRGLGVVVAIALSACTAPVAGGLSDDEANRVIVALDRAGVDASKESDPGTENRYRVLVPREETARAVTAMREEELPAQPTPGVLDALGKSSLVPSTAVEHAQLVAGLAGDLERTLMGVDGVVSARVHVSVPPPDPLGEQRPTRSTASVLVKHRGPTPPIDATSVQRLVAGAVAGMKTEDVAVVMLPRPLPPAAGESQLAHFGPITVTRGSLAYLRGFVAASVLACLALLGGLAALWSRARRAEGSRAASSEKS
jgi:type III secretion protein J